MKSGDKITAVRCDIRKRDLDKLIVKGEEVYWKEKNWLENDGKGLEGTYYKAVEENKNSKFYWVF